MATAGFSLITANELLGLLNEGGWTCTREVKLCVEVRTTARAQKKITAGVPVIEYSFYKDKGFPVWHIPCTDAIEFRLVSQDETEIWKKGTYRYSFQKE